jgi:hypothetical protein
VAFRAGRPRPLPALIVAKVVTKGDQRGIDM